MTDGFDYLLDFVSPAEEQELLHAIAGLALREAQYKGYTARRRVLSFEGEYPAFLLPLRERLAQWLQIEARALTHILVAQYRPRTTLGWHRDMPQFGMVAGISLGGVARMRFRPYPPQKPRARDVLSLDLEPRSAYVLRGKARWHWQHSISPTENLRYSITYRTLR